MLKHVRNTVHTAKERIKGKNRREEEKNVKACDKKEKEKTLKWRRHGITRKSFVKQRPVFQLNANLYPNNLISFKQSSHM